MPPRRKRRRDVDTIRLGEPRVRDFSRDLRAWGGGKQCQNRRLQEGKMAAAAVTVDEVFTRQCLLHLATGASRPPTTVAHQPRQRRAAKRATEGQRNSNTPARRTQNNARPRCAAASARPKRESTKSRSTTRPSKPARSGTEAQPPGAGEGRANPASRHPHEIREEGGRPGGARAPRIKDGDADRAAATQPPGTSEG